jgi:hypothetical protein
MRRDVYIINDAGSWSAIAADAVAKIIDNDREHDELFVQAQEAALFAIEGDDYSVMRIVVDEPLTEPEEAEWIARARWRLKVGDGKVLVSGGFDPRCLADWQEHGEIGYVKEIDVPPGDYQVVFYSYLHSMNGAVWLDDGYDGSPSPFPKLLPWFQMDYPGRSLPTWVASMLAYDEEISIADAVKSGILTIESQPLHWIGYLVHLIPFAVEMELDTPEGGWFDTRVGLRVPVRCPLGISTNCTEDREVQSRLKWLLQGDDED